jgi:hypothetical protein
MKKQISISDILSAIVFIPQSPVLLINIIRSILKWIFRLLGKIVAMILF